MCLLTGTFSLEQFNSYMQQLKFKNSGYGFIADNTGLIIAHAKNPDLIGKLNLLDKSVSPELQAKTAELDSRLTRLFNDGVQSDGQVRDKYTFIDGREYIGVYTPIHLPDGQQWGLIVAAPEEEATQEVGVLARILSYISIVCLIISSLLVVIWSRHFTKPIEQMRDEALLLADGDLRVRRIDIRSDDEIGQLAYAFQQMAENFRDLIAKVQVQAELLAASSEEFSASSYQSASAATQVAESITRISRGSDHQATVMHDITGIIGGLSDNTKQIASTAKHIAETANATSKASTDGCQAVDKAMEQMLQIGKESEAVQIVIQQLVDGSDEISEIVTLIASIAGQTNLLALNAAIEAAQAGEHGKGFAVVAEEVRKLADQSNKAAQRIGNMLKKNEQNMNKVIAASKDSAASVKTGTDVVSVARENFNNIADSVTQLSLQTERVAKTIDQMSSNSYDLLKSVQDIDKISIDNAAQVQNVSAAIEEQTAAMNEIASSSQGMAHMAGDLKTVTEKFSC